MRIVTAMLSEDNIIWRLWCTEHTGTVNVGYVTCCALMLTNMNMEIIYQCINTIPYFHYAAVNTSRVKALKHPRTGSGRNSSYEGILSTVAFEVNYRERDTRAAMR